MEERIFQVSEFNEFINVYLDQIGEVVIEGEVSQIRVNQGKWVFGTIKDSDASVEIFGVTFQLSGYDLIEEGMLVHVYGTPRLYEKTGRFSVFANRIVPAGEGALQIAFEKLKEKLTKEGLFDETRKRELPNFPQKIGFITAKGSQAYKDFVKVLGERMGGLEIQFYPVNVQGRDSVDTIKNAFNYFNKVDTDVLVLVRGGGSLEDLQSFNDEEVIRAIFSSKVPVICGVGHEGDVTLSDMVADLRASTPSNAAELVVKDKYSLSREVDHTVSKVIKDMNYSLTSYSYELDSIVSLLLKTYSEKITIVKELIKRFNTQFSLFNQTLVAEQKNLSLQTSHLTSLVNRWINITQDAITVKTMRIGELLDMQIKTNKNNTKHLERLLKNLDYRNVMKRGFSITFDSNSKLIKSTKNLSNSDSITTKLIDGTITSTVSKISK